MSNPPPERLLTKFPSQPRWITIPPSLSSSRSTSVIPPPLPMRLPRLASKSGVAPSTSGLLFVGRISLNDTVKHAILAWRRLVRQSGKMPWRITTLDLQGHLAWLQQEGFALPTVNNSVGFFSSFFDWCSAERGSTRPALPISTLPSMFPAFLSNATMLSACGVTLKWIRSSTSSAAIHPP